MKILQADSVEKMGIYDQLVVLKGYPYLDDKDEYSAPMKGCDIMTPVSAMKVLLATGMSVLDIGER